MLTHTLSSNHRFQDKPLVIIYVLKAMISVTLVTEEPFKCIALKKTGLYQEPREII